MSKTQNVTKKTLDTQHLNKINEFHERETSMAKLQEEIEIVSNRIKEYKSRGSSQELSDEEFEAFMCCSDKLIDLKKTLEKYDKYDDEVDYYMNTAPILFQYYDILENGKDMNNVLKPSASGNSILKYFVQKPHVPTPLETNPSPSPQVDRASLLEKYMNVTDVNYLKTMECNSDKCPFCESTDRNTMLNDGMIYCNDCSTIEYIIIDHERPSYKDPPKEMDPLKDFIYLIILGFGF